MKEATIQMDYAKNYRWIYQDEPSAMFYTCQQITIHPVVVHYQTLEGSLENQSFVGITADTIFLVA